MNPLIAFSLLIVAVSSGPVPQFLHAGVPVLAHQVHVPVTKTVHFDVKNVVTGFSTSIIKPAITAPALAHPFLTQPAVVAPQPAVIAAPQQTVVVAGQFPFQLPQFPSPPSDTPNPGTGGGSGYPQFPQIPGLPAFSTPAPIPPPEQSTPNPIGQFPGGSNPGDQFPSGQNPGDQFPSGQNPGDQFPSGQNPGDQIPGGQAPLPGTPGGSPPPMPDINNPPQIPGQPAPYPNVPQIPNFPGQPGDSATTTTTPKPSDSPSVSNDPTTENPFPSFFPNFPAFAPPSTLTQIQILKPVDPAPAPAPVEIPAAAPAIIETQSDDTEVVVNPEFRSAVVQAPATTVVQAPTPVVAPAPVTFAAAPVVPQRVQLHQDTPANVVSQEAVLAPVRTHTQITPQITQIQPEVTVRKVIHDVPVATPVVAQPVFQHHVAAPVVHAAAPVHGFQFAF